MFQNIPNNLWAFLLFVIAAILAVVGAAWHDKDLIAFAGTVATAGGVVFHGGPKSAQQP